MDLKDVEVIASRMGQNPEFSRYSYDNAITEYVERYLDGKEVDNFHLPFNMKIGEIASIFDLESLKGKEVVAEYLMNKVSGYERKYFDTQRVRNDISVEGILNRVADMGAGDDYPNDFYAGVVIKLEEQTCIAFQFDQEEEVGVCDLCHDSGYDDAYHGCGHDIPDTYTQRYWFTLCRPENVNQIEWGM